VNQLVLDIHIELKPPILQSAALDKELAEVADGTNAVEIRERQRDEMLGTSANLLRNLCHSQ
jgi:hypothetical protein